MKQSGSMEKFKSITIRIPEKKWEAFKIELIKSRQSISEFFMKAIDLVLKNNSNK